MSRFLINCLAGLIERGIHASEAHSSILTLYCEGHGAMMSWSFLGKLAHLRTLAVGGTSYNPLFGAVGLPEDEGSALKAPRLPLRGCHEYGEGVACFTKTVNVGTLRRLVAICRGSKRLRLSSTS